MDAELKAAWIAALRSGEFKQGKHWLRGEDTADGVDEFCCLGVLADCAIRRGSLDARWDAGALVVPDAIEEDDDDMDSLLSDQVLKILQLQSPQQLKLAAMNDGAGGEALRTFSEIADWIEANV